jgi:16S rRNA (adenine1518-N6/adenine1519-N6)-dimethyltransferase
MGKITRYGQHFLTNRNIADKIAQSFFILNRQSKNPILEIGPGKGILTENLIKHSETKIFCVEIDLKLTKILQDRFQENIQIVNTDILKLDPGSLNAQSPVDIISNTPYYISGKLIDWIVQNHGMINSGVFMMQKEFGDKLLGKVKSQPRSIIFNRIFSTKFLFNVSRGSFSPPPKIRSSVFSFIHSKQDSQMKNYTQFYNFLKLCFKSRRKKLISNLSNIFKKSAVINWMKKNELNLNLRAEEFPDKLFYSLFKSLSE